MHLISKFTVETESVISAAPHKAAIRLVRALEYRLTPAWLRWILSHPTPRLSHHQEVHPKKLRWRHFAYGTSVFRRSSTLTYKYAILKTQNTCCGCSPSIVLECFDIIILIYIAYYGHRSMSIADSLLNITSLAVFTLLYCRLIVVT